MRLPSVMAQDDVECDIVFQIPQSYAHEHPVPWGESYAIAKVGADKLFGFDGDKNFKEALFSFEEAANKGFWPAYNSLGVIYLKGWAEVEPDVKRAFEHFQTAADRGYAPAENNLGIMLQHGVGTAANISDALDYYKKAAEKGYAPALNNLAVWNLENGVSESVKTCGLHYLENAATQGFVPSMFNVASLFYEGKLVDQDYQKAAIYYQSGGERGDPLSQFNLGLMYISGQGVERDIVRGYQWLFSAERGGVEKAKALMGALESIIEPGELETARAESLSTGSTPNYALSQEPKIAYEDLYKVPELLSYWESKSVDWQGGLGSWAGVKNVKEPWLENYLFGGSHLALK